ncbi:hypothetical protein [Desulforegula conservatrix]|uniref:hypothetical protein n=1 Tax=Desulforegula conservatrix TaxID=153026 RepID=UPI0003FD713C|nr:hypothetical protein [Desulforegula conservatrix]
MKSNPNKATIEEITKLYHYIILPLLVRKIESQKLNKMTSSVNPPRHRFGGEGRGEGEFK